MRNLLWKFAVLAGVTGIGFLVVVQALDGLSGESAISAQQTVASQPPAETSQSPPMAGALPPLETKETLAFADPFPGDLQPPASSGNPFPPSSRVSPASGPGANLGNGQVTPVKFPLEFPVQSSLEGPAPVEPDPADLPDLPELIPASNQAEAFSQGQAASSESPFSEPPVLGPPSAVQSDAQEDPFADPVRVPEKTQNKSEPTEVPFDPYEPLPTGETKADAPVLNGPTGQKNADPPVLILPAPESAGDPLDLNPPQDNPFAEGASRSNPSPGRASVQTQEASSAAQQSQAESRSTLADPSGPSLTVPPALEPSNQVKPIPDLSKPVAQSAAPAADPFSDPLDQLTFPEPASPAANAPKMAAETLPEIQPRELLNLEPPASPFPNPNVTQTKAEPPMPGSEVPPAASEGPEGAGVLGSSVSSGAQQPELKIEKTAPPKAALGQPMIYQIIVRNVGKSAAHEVIVEDQVPKGTQLTGTIPRGEMADNRLIWKFGVIQPGEEKKIAVRVIPTQEGQIGSVAKVSFVAEVAARTVVAAAKLDLEFTGPTNAVVGDAVTFHFKLANTGSGDASKVYLRNILPEGLNHPDGNDLEYEVGTLKAGEVKEIDLTLNATKAGEFTNKAILSGSGGLQKEADVKVKIIAERLTITRTGPKRRYVGRTASFSNTIANQSEAKIAPIRVVEVLPAGMEFVEASAGGQFDPQRRTVTWAIAELGPRENQQLTLDLMAKKEGPQSSEVVAFDPNGTRAVVQSETTVEGYTALRLDVREYAEPVDVGEQVGLKVVASNRGTQATTKVVVKLTIPEEMEFLSAKGPVDYKRDGATVTFDPVESLKAQGELEFELVLKSAKPGDARVRLEIGSDQMPKPLSREEAIRILTTRP